MRFADMAQATRLFTQWNALCLVQQALASYPAGSRITITPENCPAIELSALAIRNLAIHEMARIGQHLRQLGATDVPSAQAIADAADHTAREALG